MNILRFPRRAPGAPRTRSALATRIVRLLLVPMLLLTMAPGYAAPPLRVGYSDWPGWVAFQIGIEKHWFEQAGVNVRFEWFDYSASLDAFSAGQIDAVTTSNGDALVTGAGGAKSVMILITDYSNGNDMMIAKPGIRSVRDLKGRKVAVERGLLEHLLLDNALTKHGLKESDITIVNAKTNEMPQVLAAGDVAAVLAWQPIAGQAMQRVPGARPIYTSANEPGLIIDGVVVNPTSLATRRAEWAKFVKVWDRIVAYINDPRTQADAVRIMAARVSVPPATYRTYLRGTRFLTLKEGAAMYVKAPGFRSVYGSARVADAFNVRNGVYRQPQNVDAYLDGALTRAAAGL